MTKNNGIKSVSGIGRVLFRTMGLRHLVIVNVHNEVVGIVTRKDLVHLDNRTVRGREQSVFSVFSDSDVPTD